MPIPWARIAAWLVGRSTHPHHLHFHAQEMSAYQRSHAFSSLPTILEYLGFVFNCGNLLGGPFVEFKDYQDWIRLQGLWSRAKKPPKLPAFIQVRA